MFIPDPGSDFFPSRIPDPTFFHPGSRIRTVSIPDPGYASKNLSILTPKKQKKWFLSTRKYDPGCSSRIPDPDADFLPIPDPRSRIQGSKRRRIPDPQHWLIPWMSEGLVRSCEQVACAVTLHRRTKYSSDLKNDHPKAPKNLLVRGGSMASRGFF